MKQNEEIELMEAAAHATTATHSLEEELLLQKYGIHSSIAPGGRMSLEEFDRAFEMMAETRKEQAIKLRNSRMMK